MLASAAVRTLVLPSPAAPVRTIGAEVTSNAATNASWTPTCVPVSRMSGLGETLLPIREYGWNCPRRLSGSSPINADPSTRCLRLGLDRPAGRCELLDRPRGQCELGVGRGGTFAVQPLTERQRELAHKRPGTGKRY